MSTADSPSFPLASRAINLWTIGRDLIFFSSLIWSSFAILTPTDLIILSCSLSNPPATTKSTVAWGPRLQVIGKRSTAMSLTLLEVKYSSNLLSLSPCASINNVTCSFSRVIWEAWLDDDWTTGRKHTFFWLGDLTWINPLLSFLFWSSEYRTES